MPIIDLTAKLREIKSSRSTNANSIAVGKLVVEVEAPEFPINLNEDEIAQFGAQLVADAMKENLLAGLRLDGTPAPPLAQSTLERREYRREQSARGGKPSERYKDKKFKSRAVKNFKRRFKASQSSADPNTSPGGPDTPAVESGLMVNSFKAVRESDGSYKIFTANSRGLTDRSGNSPMGRALGYPVSRQAEALKAVAESPKVKSKFDKKMLKVILKGGKKILGELEETFNQLAEVKDEIDE